MNRILLDFLAANDGVLSRTVKSGNVDTAVSPSKRLPLVSGNELSHAVEMNRRRVAEFIEWRQRYMPNVSAEVNAALIAIATLASFSILPEGLFRTWDYPVRDGFMLESMPEVTPAEIQTEMGKIGQRIISAKSLSPKARAAEVASIEWDIGIGPLHPFYDGCGRISRYFSMLGSIWLQVDLVRHESREIYMAAASQGRANFIAYYLGQEPVSLAEIINGS